MSHLPFLVCVRRRRLAYFAGIAYGLGLGVGEPSVIGTADPIQ